LAGSHHEKWDGTGYPYGLKGDDIPLQGRLMAIVDVYDALTNDRPYKKAFSHEEAVEIIKSSLGTHFDPIIDNVFLTHEKEFKNRSINEHIVRGEHAALKPIDKLNSTMKIVANVIGTHDGTVAARTENMQRYLKIFVNALLDNERYRDEISGWDVDLFIMSSQLYDVGKIAVNDSIMNKAGKLTEEEFEKVKTHTDFGVKIIQQIKENVDNKNLLRHAEALAGCHHEKWDGTGYPLGLKGKGIPLQGRIMAIVDVYEALVSDRPYRGRKTHKEAVEIIKICGGTHFDPELVDVFIENEKKFEKAESL